MERTVRKGQGVWIVLRVVMVAFLMVNLWYRFSTIFDYSRFVGALFVFLGICSLVVRQLDKNNHPIIDVSEHAHTGLISTKYFPSFG